MKKRMKKVATLCLAGVTAMSTVGVTGSAVFAKGDTNYDVDNMDFENVELRVAFRFNNGSDTDGQAKWYYKALDEFNKENEGKIHVTDESISTESDYEEKLTTDFASGNVPNAFLQYGGSRTREYVDAGYILDLTPYFEQYPEWKERFNAMGESLTDFSTYGYEGSYGIPFTAYQVMLFYNEDILNAAGVREIPRTWDAFRGMCYKIWKWSEREKNEIASLQTSPEGYLYFMDHMLLEEGTEKDRNDIGTISEVLKRLQEIYVYSTSENAEYSYLDETRLFNEGKLAIYVNGVWGASMISENINAKYALLPTTSGKKLSCESACFGYVLGKSGNEQKEEASIRFLKYMLSKKVQTRILEETEQIPANKQVVLDSYEKEMPRLFQAASLVLSAEDKIEVPDNLWTYEQKAYFTENIFRELTGKISPEAFTRQLGEMKIDK